MGITGTANGLTLGIDTFVQTCERAWPADQPAAEVFVRAPGRLDCMGGMADFSGALALQLPLECCVYAAAAKREDLNIRIETLSANGEQGVDEPVVEWPISWFYQSDGQVATAEDFAARFEGAGWGRHVAGVFFALLDSGELPHFGGGVTLMLQSDIPATAGLASSAAIQSATAHALSVLFDAGLGANVLAGACRRANEAIVGDTPGLVDHLTCLCGEADALLQIRCQPGDVIGTLTLPSDVTFAAVNAGFRLPIYAERYAQNRAASLMGRFLIERVLRHSGAIDDPTGGYLANVSPNEYVRRFRNELPVKLRGREFIAAFGQPEELEVTIDPKLTYKVRSRTEHHIYENDRTHRLLERLARVRRTGERDALIEAGELMYASHWSYGQRCGMGSIETDVLVNLIRERGAAKGLFGAKVTAGGCGGSVAVLMAKSSTASEALADVCRAYEQSTGKHATVLQGSTPGSLVFGHKTPTSHEGQPS